MQAARLLWLRAVRPSIHRPRMVLLAQPEIRTGEVMHATVRIFVKRRVQIRCLVAEWTALEEARFGRGQHTARKTIRLPAGAAVILGETILEPGEYDYGFSLRIPDSATPSYSGKKCSTTHSLALRLEVPWWLARRTSYDLPVRQGRASRRYPGEALLFASREGGPEANKPYIEGSLATDVVAPGDLLRGAVALLNTEHNRYTKLSVALVGSEYLHDGSVREFGEVQRLAVDVETSKPAEGQSFPLALRIPSGIPVSARGSLWSMRWSFEVTARVRFGRDESLQIPVTVAPEHMHSDTNLLRPVPRVGSARQLALWNSVATAHRMRSLPGVMQGATGEVELKVTRLHFGRRGWSLIAELSFPSMRLGAQVREASLLRGTGFGGMKLASGAWARAHHVSARSEEQAIKFFRLLVPHLARFANVRMDDTTARLERSGSGLRRAKLNDFVAEARACAEAIAGAKDAIVAPSEFADVVPQWREFAGRLRGELHLGDMSVVASYRGLPVIVAHEWNEGRLSATSLRVVELCNQEPEACFALSGPRAGEDTGQLEELVTTALDADRRETLAAALEGALSFTSAPNEDVLIVPPLRTPDDAMKYLAALVTFSAARAAKAGPYR